MRRNASRKRRELAGCFVESALTAFPFVLTALTFSTIELAERDVFGHVLDEQVARPLPDSPKARLECRLCHYSIEAQRMMAVNGRSVRMQKSPSMRTSEG